VTGQRLDYWDPNVFLAALAAGTIALVVVSLMTEPEPAAQTSSFMKRLATSSDDDVERPLFLVNILRLPSIAAARGWRVFDEDLRGFAMGWVVVFALVAATAVFLQL
jgi:hypothetical protein